jgi:hypothetical protein
VDVFPLEKAMKLRVTKGRIACAVVLLPVLYLLNIGPILYCTVRFSIPFDLLGTLYNPMFRAVAGTPFDRAYARYWHWWLDRARQDRSAALKK